MFGAFFDSFPHLSEKFSQIQGPIPYLKCSPDNCSLHNKTKPVVNTSDNVIRMI